MAEKIILLEKTIVRINEGIVKIHGVNKKDFEKLKKIGYYKKSGNVEWVIIGSITFFKE